MEITINYLAVVVCAILALIIGVIWYGPLFGKKWMEIIGADSKDIEARKKMQKNAKWLYIIQFVITLFQVWVLAIFMNGWTDFDTAKNVLWIWAGFIIPTIAATAMWNNDTKKVQWTRFLIQGGYQLVVFIIFGWILMVWK